MTLTVPLTAEEEKKLVAIAKQRGISPDAFVKAIVRDILEQSSSASRGDLSPQEREQRLKELFSTFDSLNVQSGVSEEAFHREHWYR